MSLAAPARFVAGVGWCGLCGVREEVVEVVLGKVGAGPRLGGYVRLAEVDEFWGLGWRELNVRSASCDEMFNGSWWGVGESLGYGMVGRRWCAE